MTLHASKGLEFPYVFWWAWKRACCRTRAASMKTMSMKSGVWPMWGSPARKRADLHPVPRAPSVRRTGAAGAEPLPAGTAAGRFGVGNRAQSGEPAGADAEGAEPSGQYPRPAGQGQRRELKDRARIAPGHFNAVLPTAASSGRSSASGFPAPAPRRAADAVPANPAVRSPSVHRPDWRVTAPPAACHRGGGWRR